MKNKCFETIQFSFIQKSLTSGQKPAQSGKLTPEQHLL